MAGNAEGLSRYKITKDVDSALVPEDTQVFSDLDENSSKHRHDFDERSFQVKVSDKTCLSTVAEYQIAESRPSTTTTMLSSVPPTKQVVTGTKCQDLTCGAVVGGNEASIDIVIVQHKVKDTLPNFESFSLSAC